jgi:hypothetical protein
MAEVDHRPDLRLGAGVAATIVVASLGPAVWAWSVRDRLPTAVARHWGVGGQVTGTWSLTAQLLVLGTLTLLAAGVLGTVAVVSRQPVAVRRTLSGCAVVLAAVLGASQVDALSGQLDLADPFDAPAPGAGMALGVVVGLLVAVGVGALASEPPHRRAAAGPPAAELPRLPRPVPPSPTFEARSALSRGLVAVVGLTAVAFGVPVLLGQWWVGVLALAILGPVVAMARFTTRIDGEGLRVEAAGIRLVDVPVAQVVGADVIDHLDAFWEFGGWGLRVDAHGRTGVVARSGPAISVVRADGSELVVTVDDAARAAATLNSVADAHHGR